MASESVKALDEISRVVAAQAELCDALTASPAAPEGFGDLVAAGPRAEGDPATYAFVVEAIREGYLLHYGQARLFPDSGPDLRLLAGDFLYALGLERLATLSDAEAVSELADLISLCATLHAATSGEEAIRACNALWLAEVVAVACGPDQALVDAKAGLAANPAQDASPLVHWARAKAAVHGVEHEFGGVGDQIGFRA